VILKERNFLHKTENWQKPLRAHLESQGSIKMHSPNQKENGKTCHSGKKTNLLARGRKSNLNVEKLNLDKNETTIWEKGAIKFQRELFMKKIWRTDLLVGQ
jgi:hypothetical protein